jgi:hypothetical protein
MGAPIEPAAPLAGGAATGREDPAWSLPEQTLFQRLGSGGEGLSFAEARRRLALHGPNHREATPRRQTGRLLLRQFGSPIILILLGVWQEHGAAITGESIPVVKQVLALPAATPLGAQANLLPLTPLGRLFGFVPLPSLFLLLPGLIPLGDVITAEAAKARFYRRSPLSAPGPPRRRGADPAAFPPWGRRPGG